MKTLEESIKILEHYLHLDVNIDPLFEEELGVSRIYNTERKYYWELVICKKEKINSDDIDPPIGGTYIVDKENGDIYTIGSSPYIDWEKEFNNFKESRESQIHWKPNQHDYLSCRLETLPKYNYLVESIECSMKERETKVEQEIKKQIINGSETCMIFLKPFESEIGEIRIGSFLKPTTKNMNVVSKEFTGNIFDSSRILSLLKKYVRINNLKLTDNYWIETNGNCLNKEYENWSFLYKLECEQKENSR